jgi:hypothetical protein
MVIVEPPSRRSHTAPAPRNGSRRAADVHHFICTAIFAVSAASDNRAFAMIGRTYTPAPPVRWRRKRIVEMRCTAGWFRLVATTTSGALLLAPSLAAAQTQFNAPQYQAQQAPAAPPPAQQQVADPPAVVGRVANLVGTVSFHTDDQTEWEPATLNYPVTSGGSFWTQPGARAELEVGVSRLVLDQTTLLDVVTVDEATTALTLNQGGLFLWVRDIPQGNATVVSTPRGQITITRPGHYVVLAGDADHPTRFMVLDGAGQIDGVGDTVQLAPGQTASIAGDTPYQVSIGAQPLPQFAAAEMARERPPPPPPGNAPPPVLTQMTGGDALIGIGTWQASPEYGRVWYPPVQQDWVPYRDGHWAWVAPWGWTWVDDAPWGFAPFHYGRWVQVGPRWGWIPEQPGVAVVERPVYAPALVTFIGVAAGVAVGAALAGSVGWIPLGPREIYRPPYRHSDRYLRNVNIYNVRNVTNYRVTQTNVFVNRRAATMVPRGVMQRSERVAPHLRPVPQQAFAHLRPIAGRPVVPTRATAGMTPDAARRLNLPRPAPGAAPHRPPAPGPAFHPMQRTNAPGRPQPAYPGQTQPHARPPARPDMTRPDMARPAPGAPGIRPQPGRPETARPQPGHPPVAHPPVAHPPVAHPDARPAVRPATPGAVRPPAATPPAQRHPTPSPRPMVQPQVHTPQSQPRPAPQPRPQPRPAPQFHPQARPQPHPAPQFHPQARPQPHPAPQFHPQARPAPQAHPQPHPAPQQHREAPHRP